MFWEDSYLKYLNYKSDKYFESSFKIDRNEENQFHQLKKVRIKVSRNLKSSQEFEKLSANIAKLLKEMSNDDDDMGKDGEMSKDDEMGKVSLQTEFYVPHSLQNEVIDCLNNFTLQRVQQS